MARIYLKKEPGADWKASTQSRIQLSRNYHINYLVCKLTVAHTNSSASFLTDGIANLINSIQIVGNGSKTIKHIDVKKLVANAVYDQGKSMQSVLETADGDKTSTLYFTVDFSQRGMMRPQDTIENSSLYTTFDMLIDWAASSNLGTGITVTSATLDVNSHQLVGYSRNVNEKIAHNEETQLTEEITSTTTEYQINLPVKKIYKRFLIASTLNGNRVNTIINNIKLKSGTTVFAEWKAADLKADNIDRKQVLTESDVDGLYLLDMVPRGRNSDALDTRIDFNTLELVLDVTKQTGTNKVIVYSDVFDVEENVEVSTKG
jgi:hypothetical protein